MEPRGTPMPGRRDPNDPELGSGSILVVALAGLLLLLGLGAAFVTATAVAHRRAQAGADLAALAGAESLQRGRDPCAAAAEVAAGNGTLLVACQPDGRHLVVTVRREGPELFGYVFTATGRAHAGPA